MAVTNVAASLILSGNRSTDAASIVTAVLGIEPTRSHEYGDPHRSQSLAAQGKVMTESKWVFSQERTMSHDEDPHGMESLVRLAERFEPLAPKLAELSANYHIVVSVFGSSDSSQGGLLIGPETMRRLGLLSASFMQKIWMHEYHTAEDIAEWELLIS